MHRLDLFSGVDGPGRVLALGPHCDDIEIGCGGTLLQLLAQRPSLEVTWVVFCSNPTRAGEARASAAAFLEGAGGRKVVVHAFRDGFLPWSGAAVKEAFEGLKAEATPDLIFAPYREDRHQDHRLISDLAWNTWRRQMILEYEIPKYDGDFGAPNFFSPLTRATLARKVELLLRHFPSQANRSWFSADLFQAVARIRGMEAAAEEGLAEGFYVRKALFAARPPPRGTTAG